MSGHMTSLRRFSLAASAVLLMCLPRFYACAEEIALSFELPEDLHELEIEELDPYPVTTASTDAKKTVYLSNWSGLPLCGARIAVCYADGSFVGYVTDECGRARINSARRIMKVAFLRFHGFGERFTRWQDIDGLFVTLMRVVPSSIVDVLLFPSDTYVFILNFP